MRTQFRVFLLLYVSYAALYISKRSAGYWGADVLSTVSGGVANVGAFSSAFESAGGVGKIIGGFLVDWYSPALILCGSLAISAASHAALISLGIVLVSANLPVSSLSFVWAVNGLAQSFAWPALARVFMNFFPEPSSRGKWYAILATSQNFGAALTPSIIVYASRVGWDGAPAWAGSVAVPGLAALSVAALVFMWVADAPEESLPAIASAPPVQPLQPGAPLSDATPPPSPRAREQHKNTAFLAAANTPAAGLAWTKGVRRRRPTDSAHAYDAPPPLPVAPPPLPVAPLSLAQTLVAVFGAASSWLLGINYFFNTLMRNGFTEVPLWLLGSTGLAVSAQTLALAVGAYEVGAAAGGLAAGWVSDRMFSGRRGPVIVLFSFAAVPVPLLLLVAGPGGGAAALHGAESAVVLAYAMLGFFAFGPHVLNGLAAREFSDPRVQSTASGLSKAMGQLGGTVAGVPLGALLASQGWQAVMLTLAGASAAAGIAALPLWYTLPFVAKGSESSERIGRSLRVGAAASRTRLKET